jgi:hypothetical protein
MQHGPTGNIVMNGRFARECWRRLTDAEAGIECLTWRQTYAADRWKIRYAKPNGATVSQAWSCDEPKYLPGGSLEIRGAAGVTENVLLGQRIESAEANRYRRRLYFSAWVKIESPIAEDRPVLLLLGTPKDRDIFGDAFNSNIVPLTTCNLGVAAGNEWTRLECELDGREFNANGLSMELEFPASALNGPETRIRVAGVALSDGFSPGLPAELPTELERLRGRRYFQRYDSRTIIFPGRSLSARECELRFQIQFPEMRIAPACTLVGALQVIDTAGNSADGFVFDVIDSSRCSVIIRATREYHGLRDGCLTFAHADAALLLEAEL